MADLSIHNVKKIWIAETREFDTFISRTIYILDEKGQKHEVNLYSHDVDSEEALRVWL